VDGIHRPTISTEDTALVPEAFNLPLVCRAFAAHYIKVEPFTLKAVKATSSIARSLAERRTSPR
jgi:hypothetical protein